MTQTSLFGEYNMCQWHRLVSDVSWYVPMTRYRIFDEYMCQWHRFVYSMNIYVCQWHEMDILWIYVCQWHEMGLFDNVEKLTKCYFYCLWPSMPTIRCMVGLDGLLRCKNVLNEVKYGDQVFTEGHDSPEQDWCPGLLCWAMLITKIDFITYNIWNKNITGYPWYFNTLPECQSMCIGSSIVPDLLSDYWKVPNLNYIIVLFAIVNRRIDWCKNVSYLQQSLV